MWKKEVTIETSASKEQIWKQWTQVETWNQWDTGVRKSKIEGSFKKGTQGILQPTSGPKSNFTLTKVEAQEAFISSASLPLAKIHFTHKMTELNGNVFVTHGVEIKGLTSFIFSKVIGKKIVAELPQVLENLSHIAKQN